MIKQQSFIYNFIFSLTYGDRPWSMDWRIGNPCFYVLPSFCYLGPIRRELGNSSADQLSNDLYYSWVRWALYAASAAMLTIGLVMYHRSKGICTFDDAIRNRRKIINTASGDVHNSNRDLPHLELHCP